MRSRPYVAALAAIPVLVSTVLLAPPASAAPVAVACGDTVTGEAYLAADLTCAGDGLTLVGDVTLDLAGHTLAGDGSGTALLLSLDATQTVSGGHVEGWATGVAVDLSTQVPGESENGEYVLTDVVLAENQTAVDLGVDSLLSGHTATFSFSGATFERNALAIGGLWGGVAEVTGSRFVDNGTVVRIDNAGASIRDSHLEGNGVVVARLLESSVTIARSTLRDNGVVAEGGEVFSAIELIRNDIRGSDLVVGPGDALVWVVDNRVTGNDVALDLGASYGEVSGNTFRGNRVAFTSDGPVEGWDVTLRVERNTFTRNGDAVVTTGAGTHVGSNVAQYNTGWGIHAPGVTDLGGNRAWANGRSPQCVGVVCQGRPRS